MKTAKEFFEVSKNYSKDLGMELYRIEDTIRNNAYNGMFSASFENISDAALTVLKDMGFEIRKIDVCFIIEWSQP